MWINKKQNTSPDLHLNYALGIIRVDTNHYERWRLAECVVECVGDVRGLLASYNKHALVSDECIIKLLIRITYNRRINEYHSKFTAGIISP